METLSINPQFVTDGTGQKIGVFLTIVDFEKLIEELEDFEDIKVFEEAEKRKDKEFISFEQAEEEMKSVRKK